MKKIFNTQNPEHFTKIYTDKDVNDLLVTLKDDVICYDTWRKVLVEKKTKRGEVKQFKKMKILREETPREIFIASFKNEIIEFREHVLRINTQYLQQRFLKENLKKRSRCCPYGFR